MKSIVSTAIFLLLCLLGLAYAIFGLPFKPYNEELLIVFWVGFLVCSGVVALVES